MTTDASESAASTGRTSQAASAPDLSAHARRSGVRAGGLLGAVITRPWLVIVSVVFAAGGVAAAAGAWSGASRPLELPGLVVSDPLVVALVPVIDAAARTAQLITVGAILAALVLLPVERDGGLSPYGWFAARIAARAGLVWGVLQLTLLPLTTADLLGVGLDQLSVVSVWSTVSSVSTGQQLGLVAAAAFIAAAAVALALTWRGVAVAAVAAVVALAAQSSGGHASSAGNHQVAVSTLLLHLVGVVAWAGGLIALLIVAALVPRTVFVTALRRFSTVALWSAVLVVASGVVNALVRLGVDPARWAETRYGALVLVKTVLTAGLLAFGAWHRRRTIARVAAGAPRAFLRLAASEAVLFAGVMGVAAALARTPPPATGRVETAAEDALGFAMPPVISFGRLVGSWYPEPVFLTAAVAAAVGYVAAVVRLHRRGVSWSGGRTLAWLIGCSVVIVASSSGLARYAYVLASAHMAQHIILQLVAAPLLVLGAPLTLALRTVPGGDNSPRSRLLAAVHHPVSRAVTHPAVVFVGFAVTPYVVYFSGLYELSMRSHFVHLLLMAHFLIGAVLFFTVVVGIDPLPSRPPFGVRLIMLLVVAIAHALFGVALMQQTAPLAPDWWADIARPWWVDAVEDTTIAGGFAWTFGELPMFFILYVLVRQWIGDDERQQRRRDRAADIAGSREANAVRDYNAMLADLATKDGNAR